MLAHLVALFGLLVIGIGLVGVARPAVLMDWIRRTWASDAGMPVAVVFRLVLGIVLVLAAPDCRYPVAIRVLGYVSIAAAVLMPLLGRDALNRWVGWWLERPAALIRVWALVAAAFGAFLVYAGS